MTGSQRSCFHDFDRRSCNTSLFNRPGLFVGLSKSMAESESSGSPKSPLDCRIRSPRSPIWNREKVGLGLISRDECRSSRIVFGSSRSRNTLFYQISSPKVSVDRPLAEVLAASSKSLPSNYSISFDLHSELSKKREELPLPASRSSPRTDSVVTSGSMPIASGFTASISATEIERSEDYTRIISRGPNPKTTHIFGDCIFEDQSDFATSDQADEGRESIWIVDSSEDHFPFPADNFLRICFCCKKKLDGEDIYIYRDDNRTIKNREFRSRRGEKAFCSRACRSREIGIEEDTEVSAGSSLSSLSLSRQDVRPA